MSSSKSPSKKNSFQVTRYGPVYGADVKFGSEERFSWQKPKFITDVAYELPNYVPNKSVVFGTASRVGMDEVNPDAKKSSTGPGSYHPERGYNFHSEYVRREAPRFSSAPRQSMAIKTASPGAIYNIEKQFYRGPDKFIGISFPTSTRQELYSISTNHAEILNPKLPKSNAITIAKRIPVKLRASDSPGAVYDVHVSIITLRISIKLIFSLRSTLILKRGLHFHLAKEEGLDLRHMGFYQN